MLRSLYSGISGLSAHQTKLDVISDNVSNVNTYGFKRSRTVFANIFNQTVGYPSAPSDSKGGVNPKQIGLGTTVAAIDKIMTGGPTETTNVASDCAIEGNGFFVVDNGDSNVYTRAGNFIIDQRGDLVHGSTAGRIQGWSSEWDDDLGTFVLNDTGVLGSINFLNMEKLSAKPTSKLLFSSNLKANSASREFIEENTLTYGVAPNQEELKVKFQKRSDTMWEFTMIDDDGNLVDLDSTNPGSQNQGLVHLYDDGKIKSIEVEGNSDIYSVSANGTIAGFDNFSISLANTTPPAVNYWTFRDINNDARKVNITFDKHSISTSTVDVYKVRLMDEDGNILDINGDGNIDDTTDFATMSILNFTGKVIGFNADPFGISGDNDTLNFDGLNIDLSVSPDSRQLLFSEASTGAVREVQLGSDNIEFRVNGTNNSMSFDFIPGTKHNTSMVVYDSQGTPHALTTNFEKLDENKWRYYMSLDKDDPIIQDYLAKFPSAQKGDTLTQDELEAIMKNIFWDADQGYTGEGVLVFNTIGRIDENATRQANGVNYPQVTKSVTFTSPGANQTTIDLDVEKITQYDSDKFTTAARSQNGYAMGMLQGYTIDTQGVIVGSYSNGEKWTIGQLAVATFQNPEGLERESGSMWSTSSNSGEAVIRKATSGGAGEVRSGQLEMSNVDLSKEFTDMIIAQRGFQANSKSITTADQILQELINLKR